jgi:hypothetical protein
MNNLRTGMARLFQHSWPVLPSPHWTGPGAERLASPLGPDSTVDVDPARPWV